MFLKWVERPRFTVVKSSNSSRWRSPITRVRLSPSQWWFDCHTEIIDHLIKYTEELNCILHSRLSKVKSLVSWIQQILWQEWFLISNWHEREISMDIVGTQNIYLVDVWCKSTKYASSSHWIIKLMCIWWPCTFTLSHPDVNVFDYHRKW